MAKGDPKAQAVGQTIRLWRSIRGLRQDELQRRADLSKNRVSKIENGELSPTFDDLRSIARVLDIPLMDLVRASEQMTEHVTEVLERELASQDVGRLDTEVAIRLIETILDRLRAGGRP